MVDHTIPMIRRRIERIELQWNIAGIDDVVIGPGRDEYGEARFDLGSNVIENRLAGSLLDAKELVDAWVNLVADLLTWLETHQHELGMCGGEEHLPEEGIPQQYLAVARLQLRGGRLRAQRSPEPSFGSAVGIWR